MPRRPTATFVGLVSDTHGLVRPEALRALAGASHIVHAGDVGTPEVIAALAAIAPLTVVRGNNDRGAFGASLPEVARLEVAGRRIMVVHELAHVARHEPPNRVARSASLCTGQRHEDNRGQITVVRSDDDLGTVWECVEADVLVVGHSHKPLIEHRGTVLLVNPGSAGPRRFSLPTTVARLWVGDRLRARIVDLGG